MTILPLASEGGANLLGHFDFFFLNSQYIIDHLVSEDVKTVQGIDFYQKRSVQDGYIVKDISFSTEGEDYKFQERVKAFTLKDFETLFEKAGVYLLDVFGDYKLNRFDAKTSERLVMIFK